MPQILDYPSGVRRLWLMLWHTVSSSRKTALALPDLARRAPWTPTIPSRVALAIGASNWRGSSLPAELWSSRARGRYRSTQLEHPSEQPNWWLEWGTGGLVPFKAQPSVRLPERTRWHRKSRKTLFQPPRRFCRNALRFRTCNGQRP